MKLLFIILIFVVISASWVPRTEAASDPTIYKHYYDNLDAQVEPGRHLHPRPPPPPPPTTSFFRETDYYVDEYDDLAQEEEEVRRRVMLREDKEEAEMEEEEILEEEEEERIREEEEAAKEVVEEVVPVEGSGREGAPPLRPRERLPSVPEHRGHTGATRGRSDILRGVLDEVKPVTLPPTPTTPTPDPLTDVTKHNPGDVNMTSARNLAVLTIMDRLLTALGPDFREELPKVPTDNTLATVPTLINVTTEPCPYKYKRCSSQTSFPSCDIPKNTDPDVWSLQFNLYFNLSNTFDKMDIINATLRLYKIHSIPLHYPKPLLIRAYAYNRSLTKKRARTMLIAEKSVLSNYTGWVTLSMERIVKRWRKPRNNHNHGLLITVTDGDDGVWNASNIFVIMSCSSGNNSLVPLPFEVQTDEEGQRYPALNIRQGSPNDEFPEIAKTPNPFIVEERPPTITTSRYEHTTRRRVVPTEEKLIYGEWVPHRGSIPTPEPSHLTRSRESGTVKERRHRRKHHHQHSRRGEERHGGTTTGL